MKSSKTFIVCYNSITSTTRNMTSSIKFTCVSGSHNENPLCYLLQVDEANILLDCGWHETMDPTVLDSLKKFVLFLVN